MEAMAADDDDEEKNDASFFFLMLLLKHTVEHARESRHLWVFSLSLGVCLARDDPIELLFSHAQKKEKQGRVSTEKNTEKKEE